MLRDISKVEGMPASGERCRVGPLDAEGAQRRKHGLERANAFLTIGPEVVKLGLIEATKGELSGGMRDPGVNERRSRERAMWAGAKEVLCEP